MKTPISDMRERNKRIFKNRINVTITTPNTKIRKHSRRNFSFQERTNQLLFFRFCCNHIKS